MTSFAFNFEDITTAENVDTLKSTNHQNGNENENENKNINDIEENAAEIPLRDLFKYLPSKLSFSQYTIIPDTKPILRRDLYDARFQFISHNLGEGDDDESIVPTLNHSIWNWKDGFPVIQGAESDLIKGIYEGGMKTWEASMDLVSFLSSNLHLFDMQKTLELGCGTALPSLYVFVQALVNVPDRPPIQIDVQDYNAPVLAMLTLPNFLLNYISIRHSERINGNINEIELDDEIIDGFIHEITSGRHVKLRFFSGSWGSKLSFLLDTNYTLCMTSETIYNPNTMPKLIKTMKDSHADTTLVAAKKVYFGVGGTVQDLITYVQPFSKSIETVWISNGGGVGRTILQIHWM